MTDWPTAAHLARPGAVQSEESPDGILRIVGIGPGLPAHLTERARTAIQTADTVYAAPLYQELLAAGNVLADTGGDPTVIESDRDSLVEQARRTFERVQKGETVVHLSGGDPTVYGKSDLLVTLAEREADGKIPIEVVPGVTAALGGAALLGAPLSNDFCTISLSTHREQAEIEHKLTGAARAGFVMALYNAWRSLPEALETIAEHRSGSVPVALLEDVGRGNAGRNQTGESITIASLSEARTELTAKTPGFVVIVGTESSRVLDPPGPGRPFLVTPRHDKPRQLHGDTDD